MKTKTKLIFVLLCVAVCFSTYAYGQRNQRAEPSHYMLALAEMKDMLDGRADMSLKRAVFLHEWAYLKGNLDYGVFCSEISGIAATLKQFMAINGLDKRPIGGNMALFEFFSNPNPLNSGKEYVYDFEDFAGKEDYTKLFVSKLMRTHSGQCRSMPLLYKILANELGTDAWIAYAPNHSFIRHKREDGSGWVNVELVNHSMPRDIYQIQALGITQQAIDKGTYMKPYGDREIILNLIAELARGYERLYGADNFVKLCYEIVLSYAPCNLTALMVKNNFLLHVAQRHAENNVAAGRPYDLSIPEFLETAGYYSNLEAIDVTGHIDIPQHLYDKWLQAVEAEKERLRNEAAAQTK